MKIIVFLEFCNLKKKTKGDTQFAIKVFYIWPGDMQEKLKIWALILWERMIFLKRKIQSKTFNFQLKNKKFKISQNLKKNNKFF